MAQLYQPSLFPALNNGGRIEPFAKLHFYKTETLFPALTYTDHLETSAHPNPLVANLAGRFPPVYLKETVVYRVRLTDAAGVLISFADVDPINVYDPLGPVVKYYRFGGFAIEAPYAGEVLMEHVVTDGFTLPADMLGSVASVGTPPASQFDLDLQCNGDSIGTMSVAPDGAVTFATIDNAAVPVAEGDVLTFAAPALPDLDINRLRFTLKGTL